MNTCTIFKIIIHNSIRIYYTTKTYIMNKLSFIWNNDTRNENIIRYNADEDCMSYAVYTNLENRSPIDLIEEQPIENNKEELADSNTKDEDEDEDEYKSLTKDDTIEQNQWDII